MSSFSLLSSVTLSHCGWCVILITLPLLWWARMWTICERWEVCDRLNEVLIPTCCALGCHKHKLSDKEEFKAAEVWVRLRYLVTVDAVVDRPGRLKIFQHSLLEALWQMMDTYEVLEVFGSGVVLGPAWIHPLDNGCHVTKDQSMHQRCRCKEAEIREGGDKHEWNTVERTGNQNRKRFWTQF